MCLRCNACVPDDIALSPCLSMQMEFEQPAPVGGLPSGHFARLWQETGLQRQEENLYVDPQREPGMQPISYAALQLPAGTNWVLPQKEQLGLQGWSVGMHLLARGVVGFSGQGGTTWVYSTQHRLRSPSLLVRCLESCKDTLQTVYDRVAPISKRPFGKTAKDLVRYEPDEQVRRLRDNARSSDRELMYYLSTVMAFLPRSIDIFDVMKRRAEGFRSKHCEGISEEAWNRKFTAAIGALAGGYPEKAFEQLMDKVGQNGFNALNLLIAGKRAPPKNLRERFWSWAGYPNWAEHHRLSRAVQVFPLTK